MAGRHAKTREAALSTLNSPAGRGLAAAMAFGTALGVAIPSAAADDDTSGANTTGALARKNIASGTVADSTREVTVSEDNEWQISQVDIQTEEDTQSSMALDMTVNAPTVEVEEEVVTEEAVATANDTAGYADTGSQAATAASTETVVATASGSGTGASISATAQSYIGSPYRWGGTTPAGWDCIGFVRYVYAQYGVQIGGYTTSVLSVGRQVPYSQAQPGDILYWPGHVAIYVGNGQNVGAWNASMGTKVGPNSWLGTPTVIRVFD